MKIIIRSFFILIVLLFLMQCKDASSSNKIILPEGDGFEWLSDYNFFVGNLPDLIPNSEAGILPYDLNTALFSDYASKKRFIYVPEGTSIPFSTEGVLELPVGSVLIKHFYYTNPSGPDDYIETRLLIRQADGWQPETYEWNDEQTDARRTIVGGTRNLNVHANGQTQDFNYLIPNQNQCKNCHANNGDIHPVGPTVPNLNKMYDYDDGNANQLNKWIENGILSSTNMTNLPQYPEIDDVSASLEERARAYLAVNCASCHRLEGSAANSGLYLEYENTTDSLSLGFWKTPVAAGAGSGGFTYVIHPGEADQSILLYRMIANEVDERMPEIGRDLIHDEGVQLIRDWIDSL